MEPNIENISLQSLLQDKKFCRVLLWYILIGAHAYESGVRIFFKRKKRKKHLRKELSVQNFEKYQNYEIDFLGEQIEKVISKYPEIIDCFKNEFFIPNWNNSELTKIITSVRKLRNRLIHPRHEIDIETKLQHLFCFFEAFLLPEKKKQLIAQIHSFTVKGAGEEGKSGELTLGQLGYVLSDNEQL